MVLCNMRITILFIALTLVGCVIQKPKQTQEAKTRSVYVDPAFQSYIENYEITFDAEIVGIGFDFDILDRDEDGLQKIGKCVYSTKIRANRDIWIHEPAWERYDKYRRTWLIYHEIAHCYENLKHRDFKLVDDCPGSITNSTIASSQCIRKHWQYYKDELLDRYNELRYHELYIDDTGGRQ